MWRARVKSQSRVTNSSHEPEKTHRRNTKNRPFTILLAFVEIGGMAFVIQDSHQRPSQNFSHPSRARIDPHCGSSAWIYMERQTSVCVYVFEMLVESNEKYLSIWSRVWCLLVLNGAHDQVRIQK